MINVIIAGSRGFEDFETLVRVCDESLKRYSNITVICGGATGADQLGEKYARCRGFHLVKFLPDWEQFGKKAGFFRNLQMAEASNMLIAFWDGQTKGTKMMIQLAKQKQLIVKVHNFISPSLFD